MGRFASFTRELRSRALPVAEVCLDAGEPGAPHRARRIDEQRLSVLDDQPGAGGGRKQAHAAADSAMRARRQCECPGGRLSRNFIPKLPKLTFRFGIRIPSKSGEGGGEWALPRSDGACQLDRKSTRLNSSH